MIVLDTNVLSELLRARPDPQVVKWMRRLSPPSVFTTSVTEAEIRYGIARLPAGRRRDDLNNALQGIFEEDFSGRVLPFDSAAAIAYAKIVAAREQTGHPISQFDAQIAAITRSRDADLATRNTRDFQGCGFSVVNPWI